ncbi:MAG: ATP synthase subunit I [Candidatus Sulfotelmatobacter sp.]
MELENSSSGHPAIPVSVPGGDFYSGAAGRISRFLIGLALVLAAVGWREFGRWAAFGFLAGSVIAFLNFHWLKNGVASLADRISNAGKPQSGAGIIARFLLRYVLMGAAAYVILTSFPACLRGLFVGLLLPVGAIACESAYEIYVVVARKG